MCRFTLFLVAVCLIATLLQRCESFNTHSSFQRRIASRKQVLMVEKKDINMPALSSTMKEGRIVSWNKKVGDKVSAGEVLLVVESDKADMDVESFEDGFLAAIYTPEGGTAAVGAVVASIVDSLADVGKVNSIETSSSSFTPPSSSSSTDSVTTGPKPNFESIMMPSLSSTMKEGKIVSWNKKVGDKVSAGDMVLVVESDKADMDVEAYEEGYLAAILVKDGEAAPVGAPVAYLAKTAAEVAAVQAYIAQGAASTTTGSSSPATTKQASQASSAQSQSTISSNANAGKVVNDGRVVASGYAKSVAKEHGIDLRTVQSSRPDQYITSKDVLASAASPSSSTFAASTKHIPAEGVINATPMARKLAAENNLDVTKIGGTGNFGRVTPDDVLRAAGKLPLQVESVQAAAAVTTSAGKAASTSGEGKGQQNTPAVLDGAVPMSGMQKAVAKNMEKSLTVPVFRVSRDIVTDSFDALYAKLKPKGVSVSAMLAKAVAMVCVNHPIMNAAYGEKGEIIYHKDVNVAMAVAMDGGLLTPTIMKAQELDLFSIARNWKDLVDRAKTKKLSPAEYSSGTITISNLGMFGVSSFDAILPPGTGAILAISAAQPRVVQLPNGFISVQKAMTVTITSDHRHIYGADVAEFLKELADLLENKVETLTMG